MEGQCVQSDHKSVTIVNVRDDYDVHCWQISDRKWDWHKPEIKTKINKLRLLTDTI